MAALPPTHTTDLLRHRLTAGQLEASPGHAGPRPARAPLTLAYHASRLVIAVPPCRLERSQLRVGALLEAHGWLVVGALEMH